MLHPVTLSFTGRPDLLCLALYVAIETGPYHLSGIRFSQRVRRVASEDSLQPLRGCLGRFLKNHPNPLLGVEEPFLLITRTPRIVTATKFVASTGRIHRASQHTAGFVNGTTVVHSIVTAAVYWGFSLQLRPEGLTALLNLPAPGRCQSLYVVLRLSRDVCF